MEYKNNAFGLAPNYGFKFNDGKLILLDSKKDAMGNPTFQFRLQDTKNGKILDTLNIDVTPDHKSFRTVK